MTADADYITLPNGGSWAYTINLCEWSENFGNAGIASGGSTVSSGKGGGAHSYLAIRIA